MKYNRNDPTYEAPSPIGRLLRTIGDKVYAYSGTVEVNSTPATLIEFETQADIYLVSQVIANNTNQSEDFNYKTYLNDKIINEYVLFRAVTRELAQPYPYEFIIPPFSKVKIVAQNWSNNNSRAHTATLTGEVIRGTD